MKNDETLNPRKSKPSESNKPKVVFTEIGGISPRNIRMWTDLVISVNSEGLLFLGFRVSSFFIFSYSSAEPPQQFASACRKAVCISHR
jgi:hypothetical protein